MCPLTTELYCRHLIPRVTWKEKGALQGENILWIVGRGRRRGAISPALAVTARKPNSYMYVDIWSLFNAPASGNYLLLMFHWHPKMKRGPPHSSHITESWGKGDHPNSATIWNGLWSGQLTSLSTYILPTSIKSVENTIALWDLSRKGTWKENGWRNGGRSGETERKEESQPLHVARLLKSVIFSLTASLPCDLITYV